MSPPTSGPPAAAPRIEVERELGSGATGRVELGVLTEPFGDWPAGHRVAVKRLHASLADDADALESFEDEARAGREVEDPSLARVLYAGRDESGPYFVMEFVDGASLREAVLEHGVLPEPLLRDVGAQIAGALAALHAAGLAHGDVKPENVRLTPAGRAVLVDLGFACAAERGGRARAAGSLPYLAPERARGGPPSAAADVFALGLTLFELAIGGHPLIGLGERGGPDAYGPTGMSSAELLRRSLEEPGGDRLLASLAAGRFATPSRIVPQLSPFFDHVVVSCLSLAAERRPTAEDLRRHLLDGEAGAWWRQAVSEAEHGQRPRRGAHLTPFVGRDAELDELDLVWTGVRAGRGAVVRVEGPPGSGKSRLVGDFADRARGEGDPPLYLYTRCSEIEESRPEGSLLHLLSRWLQLPRSASPGAREEERLRAAMPPDAAETLLAVLDPRASGRIPGSVGHALATWLLELSREHPLIVFVDDLHLAQERTLATLALLARRVSASRLMLVLARRTGEEPEYPGGQQRLDDLLARLTASEGGLVVRTLQLEPIGEEAVAELVSRLFHRSEPRLRLANVLWLRSRGNPGWLAEVLRELIASGTARPKSERDPALVLGIAPDELPLPGSLHRTISRRFRQLGVEERRWLTRLAVAGGRLTPELLERAFGPVSPNEIDEVLTRLVAVGWLTAVGNSYRFARPALREAIYRALPRDRRRRLHAALARALRPAEDDDDLSNDFQRAYHLRAAGENRELLELLRPLIARLLRRGLPQRVHSLAVWGLEALDALPSEEADRELTLEFLEIAGDSADRLGLREEERRLLDRLADMEIEPATDPSGAARVYMLHGRYAVGTGQYGLARGMLRNAAELAELAGDSRLQSDCLRRLAMVQTHVGKLVEARALARRAVRTAQEPLQVALAWMAEAQLEVVDDRVESALRALKRAFARLRQEDEGAPPGAVATALMLRARAVTAAGDPARALGASLRAQRLARRSGERRLIAEAGARLGGLLVGLDRPGEAEERLRDALLTADEIEDRRGQTLAGIWLGILLWEQSAPEARETLERAIARAVEMAFYRAEALGLAVLGRIERETGSLERALAATERAQELLDRHGSELLDRIVITGSHCLVLDSCKRGAEARALVRGLRRRMRGDNQRIADPELRRAQRGYSLQLLEAVLSPDGPVYPRLPQG